MIEEAYVSFEVAKLLKEKGFNESCWLKYDNEGYLFFNHIGYINSEEPCDDFCALAPTHQMAMKWLREEHDLIIYVKLVNDGDPCHDAWEFSVYNKFTNKSIKGHRLWFKYEEAVEAVEAALKYVLKNLI